MEQVNYNSGEVLESLNNKLDRDFNNMAVNSVNFAKYSNNVTNCITEIPQDIKLELKDGSLTLKAGSKVYIPNGFEEDGTTKKFDIITIASDITKTRAFDRQEVWFISNNGNTFNMWEYTFSGENAPTIPSGNYAIWYDTANNLVKYTTDAGTTWGSGFSLPVCLATSDSTQVVTLDQVFNGFGYIGSTVYALPGVKGLIPNGRNADGSLKNIEFTTSKVLTYSRGSAFTNYDLILKAADCVTSVVSYDEENNLNLTSIGAKSGYMVAGKVSAGANGAITSFTTKLPFRAVDHNEMETKANIDLSNILANIDYVVESKIPTEEDPTWYRVYKSGWVEQGGCFTPSENNVEITITYPKEFANTKYTLTQSSRNSGTGTTMWDGHIGSSWTQKTTKSFSRLAYTTEYNWEAKGQGA